jgi:hypothetical protein
MRFVTVTASFQCLKTSVDNNDLFGIISRPHLFSLFLTASIESEQ